MFIVFRVFGDSIGCVRGSILPYGYIVYKNDNNASLRLRRWRRRDVAYVVPPERRAQRSRQHLVQHSGSAPPLRRALVPESVVASATKHPGDERRGEKNRGEKKDERE